MPEWGDMNCIADSRVLKNKILSEIMVRRDFANRHRLWVNIWQNMIRKGLEARTEEHMVGYELNQPTIPFRNMAVWSICYGCQFFKTSKGSCPQWHSLIFSNDFLVFVLGFQVLKFLWGIWSHETYLIPFYWNSTSSCSKYMGWVAVFICSGPLPKNIFRGFPVAKIEGGMGLWGVRDYSSNFYNFVISAMSAKLQEQ